MQLIGAVSETLGLVPVAVSLLLCPCVIGLMANAAAEQGSTARLESQRRYFYPITWTVSMLAIVGIFFVAGDFVSWPIQVIYGIVSLLVAIGTFILLLIAMEGPSRQK